MISCFCHCIFCLVKWLFKYFSYFLCCLIEKEFFIYSEYLHFIMYMFSQSFNFFNSVLKMQRFRFWWSSCYHFFLLCLSIFFWFYLIILYSGLQRFSSGNFTVLASIFRYMIHFEFFFTWCKVSAEVHIFQMNIQVF